MNREYTADRALYTATAHNRTGPDGESWADGGLRVAVRSPLAPARSSPQPARSPVDPAQPPLLPAQPPLAPTPPPFAPAHTTSDTDAGDGPPADSSETNPEELLGAALASCYTMQLSNGLAEDGHPATTLDARAAVTFDPSKGGITGITLTISGDVPGMSAEDFREKARWAKENCPVSTALKSVPKELRFE